MSGEERHDDLRAHLESQRAKLEATSARIEERAGRNLFLAIGTGVLLGGVFVGSLLLNQAIFVALVAVIVAIALLELASAFRGSGRRVPRFGAMIGGVVVIAGAYWQGAQGMLLGLVLASLLLTAWRLIEGLVPRWEVPPKTLLRDIFSGLFSLVYVAFLAGFTVLLVREPGGEWWVFTLVLVVVSVDIGAYAAGITLGKHKMTPRISPNKTWEGFAGAAVAACVTATLMTTLVLGQPWWLGVIMGVLLLLSATGGDLTESLIKRNLGVKDMSSWIPGHGGFLDRLDSILPSAAVVFGVALTAGVIA
ncbi:MULTISPECIES: phosphatidate cytidylyltransferase [unclassified Leucobacter]|uniref:phosphatidate cytidylyltransferase n=1 Tax=unclassified Leucobacter TaxID=2621730 RepID=UPI00165D5A98|nr:MULTISPECIES: phosphatidate cytidylyltransferase [unclassified Leucobacter]MBC9935489.1 phosphatidate cytidylyltransferase [Leucobacter sp. cx-87]